MTARTATTTVATTDPGARPSRLRHLPALDGLRGVAVVAVLLFHGGFEWAKGGWLGVSVFFTLSGFLITNLLVAEWAAEGRISLRTFWSRRFRRLMPAALLCLLLVALYGWLWASPEQLQDLRVDLLAALAYVANWRFLLSDLSYADLFSAPSPVQHFWSLAIEEQFYVAYPVVVLLLLKLGGRRALGAALVLATVGSVAWASLHAGELDRVYYGTDTRMAELLVGGLVALWWSGSTRAKEAAVGWWRSAGLSLLGVTGLAGSLALWPTVEESADVVTRGVLPLQAVLSAGLIAASARPGLPSRLLSWRPLRAIGAVSYGLYLFHWPIFLVLDEERTAWTNPLLFGARMAATLAVTLVSYRLLEQPIRRRTVLVRRPAVGGAVVVGLAAVLIATFGVTWSPEGTEIAHADVSLEDQEITVETAPRRSSTTTTTALPGLPPPPSAPPAIMIVGDSGTYDAAPAIGAVFRDLGTSTVIDTSFPGFGLTRDEAKWRESWPDLVSEHRPQLTVVMLGGWDETFVREQGAKAYDAVLDETTQVLTVAGGRILWLGPMPGPDEDPDMAELMEARFRAVAARHPSLIAYDDIGAALRAPDGTYPRWLPNDFGELVLARKPDGWHLCPDGAARIAARIAERTAALRWSPPPRTGWELGNWRSEKRYDDPSGGCDPSSPDNAP